MILWFVVDLGAICAVLCLHFKVAGLAVVVVVLVSINLIMMVVVVVVVVVELLVTGR